MSKQILQMFAAHDGAIAHLWKKSKDDAVIVRIMNEEIKKWEAENNG